MGSTSTLQRMQIAPHSTASPPAAHRQQLQAGWLRQRLPFLWWCERRAEHPLLQRQRHRVQLAQGRELSELRGQTFRVNKPLPLPANAPVGTQPVPGGSKPLYRLYNNASAPGKNYVSNHRYVTSRTTVDAAVAIGWLDEV